MKTSYDGGSEDGRDGAGTGTRVGADGDWAAPVARGALDSVVVLPGSKSLTNRFLVLAALANDRSRLRSPLRSRDTLLMADALRSLGTAVEDVDSHRSHTHHTHDTHDAHRSRDGQGSGGAGSSGSSGSSEGSAADGSGTGDWLITPAALAGGVAGDAVRVDVGLAGTVMRFLPPVAALATGRVDIDGDVGARVRPMGPVVDALRVLGVDVDDAGGFLPLTVRGTGSVPGGAVTLDASSSSQFISGLLLSGARYDAGVTVHHEGKPVPSEPHIAMTVETLRDAGVDVDDGDANTWRVEPSEISSLDVLIEPDLSNAGPFLGAALVVGGRVRVPDWPQHTTQAGDALRDILDTMGADVSLDRDGLTVSGSGGIGGLDIDLHDAAELTPLVVALAALAESPSWIRGVAHIRFHETDRIAALAAEVNALGGAVTETEDGFKITPKPLRGGLFHTYHDHRMAMAGAVLGLAVPDVVVENVATTGKTLPDFVGLWRGMLAGGGH